MKLQRYAVLIAVLVSGPALSANYSDCNIVKAVSIDNHPTFKTVGTGAVYDNGNTVTLKNHAYPNESLRSGTITMAQDGRLFSRNGDMFYVIDRDVRRYGLSPVNSSDMLIWDCNKTGGGYGN